ncbi:MAG: hypothetical protein H6741_14775 [Alphaproteobacteria bacterium]|nr:hypothetical protein [Alphaproteobacteria bacterium]MCB9793981.1 hypothetical protein [Alphaproteobacteria bacterium]
MRLLAAALALLVACEDPDPVDPPTLALVACRGMPGVSVEAAGRAYLRFAVVEEELALWDEDPYLAHGLQVIGLTGYGVIRSNLRCEIETLSDTEVTLIRQEPDLDALATWDRREVHELDSVPRRVRFDIVSTPTGPRMKTGAAEARAAVIEARALAEGGDTEAAIARIIDLQEVFPDPLLRWEIQAFEQLAREDTALAQLRLVTEEGVLFVENQGPEDLPSGELHLDCGALPIVEALPALAVEERVALAVGEVGLEPESCAVRRPLPWVP